MIISEVADAGGKSVLPASLPTYRRGGMNGCWVGHGGGTAGLGTSALSTRMTWINRSTALDTASASLSGTLPFGSSCRATSRVPNYLTMARFGYHWRKQP